MLADKLPETLKIQSFLISPHPHVEAVSFSVNIQSPYENNMFTKHLYPVGDFHPLEILSFVQARWKEQIRKPRPQATKEFSQDPIATNDGVFI